MADITSPRNLNPPLMTQDQDLGVLGPVRPGEQGQPAEHTEHRKVFES
jgi:hypothetical protein